MQSMKCEKIFASHILNEGLIYKLHNSKNLAKNPIKSEKTNYIDNGQWQTDICKDAEHC